MTTVNEQQQAPVNPYRQPSPYEQWVASTGVPVHRGYFVEDVRTVEVGPVA